MPEKGWVEAFSHGDQFIFRANGLLRRALLCPYLSRCLVTVSREVTGLRLSSPTFPLDIASLNFFHGIVQARQDLALML